MITLTHAVREIPAALRAAYSMQGRVEIREWYFDDVERAAVPRIFTVRELTRYRRAAAAGKCLYYGETDRWLYEALAKYPIDRQCVAIMGSVKPFYEAVCLQSGGQPTTIEYNPRESEDPALRCLTPDQYWQAPVLFDAALSISSFEHDGLGRYGDPLDPDGDLRAMQDMLHIVRPGGLLFLAVPIGNDCVVWNAHRIYGPIRLPLLLAGWELLDRFGFDEKRLGVETGTDASYQPVFVLRNPGLMTHRCRGRSS